ncbi:MAG: biopolymer transporter ExbD [Gammaproteobacteria bacterium]|nr:biopolymer transporter ExbD [Gammaproteobacteria bacterium]
MAFGSLNNKSTSSPITEINVVPLVDVMLVLLVIFIITAPLLTHSIKIDLPKASNTTNQTQLEHIELSIKEDGSVFWNGEQVNLEDIDSRLASASALQPQPELHIHADRLAYYESVAKVMAAAGKAGMTRIGFITDPHEQ